MTYVFRYRNVRGLEYVTLETQKDNKDSEEKLTVVVGI